MWPLPPIHKSSAGHRGRAGPRGERRSGGRGLRRARRRQENKRARRSEPPAQRPRLGGGWERRWAGRCGAGAALGQRGPQTGRPALRRSRGAGMLRGAGLQAPAKESPGRRPGGQGHLQAFRAAPSGSLSAAPRHPAPAIWRRWEPRHPRVGPSPGGAPALARGRGRTRGGLRRGERGGGGRGLGVKGLLASLQRGQRTPLSGGAFSSWPRLAPARPPRGGVGGARRGADPARCRVLAARISASLRRAEPSRGA